MCRVLLFLLLSIIANISLAEVTLQLLPSADLKLSDVRIAGLTETEIEALRLLPKSEIAKIIKVYVQSNSDSNESSLPAVLGECVIEGSSLFFRPRFAWQLEQAYRVEFHSPLSQDTTSILHFTLPRPTPEFPTRVVEIFPSTNRLPQNLLKFYLHFSAPMQQGNVYRLIDISKESGEKLELPFLELAEELWDHSGMRLTLLLDPARVKRGLVPREQHGAIFDVGKNYRLTVRSEWPDANGFPLKATAMKEFEIIEADFEQPNPENWIIRVTSDGERQADTISREENSAQWSQIVQVSFPEQLDHSLLLRSLSIYDAHGNRMLGETKTVDYERRWIFTPMSRLEAGEYTLKINPLLEDLAGNSIARAFEVDLSKPKDKSPPVVTRNFVVP